jgi:hypothetical protein
MLLGGNIELEGFDSLEPAILVVVKKMVGSEARKISEDGIPFEKLKICLDSNSGSSCQVSAKVIFQGNEFDASAKENNLFFGIDCAFKKIIASIKP